MTPEELQARLRARLAIREHRQAIAKLQAFLKGDGQAKPASPSKPRTPRP